jgi:hypothetical protein
MAQRVAVGAGGERAVAALAGDAIARPDASVDHTVAIFIS